jgi:hypothetical protein
MDIGGFAAGPTLVRNLGTSRSMLRHAALAAGTFPARAPVRRGR